MWVLNFGYNIYGYHTSLTCNGRAEACPFGMQAAPSSIPTSGTFFRGDLGHEKKFYGHSPSSADSRRAVVSYWQKNGHKVLLNWPGGLPRNSVVRVTNRARKDLKCVEGP